MVEPPCATSAKNTIFQVLAQQQLARVVEDFVDTSLNTKKKIVEAQK
jgi:hypothetical protein